jgi:hypothetical protein
VKECEASADAVLAAFEHYLSTRQTHYIPERR